MGRGPLVEVEGAAALRRSLRAAGDDLADLRAAHAIVARIAAGGAIARAPRLSGALAATIRGSGTKTGAVIRAGFASVPYAAPIHWGWPSRGIPAHPFLSDGATATEPIWLPVYERALDQATQKVEDK